MHESPALKRSDIRAALDQVHPTPNPDQSVRMVGAEFGSWGGSDDLQPSLTLGIPFDILWKRERQKEWGGGGEAGREKCEREATESAGCVSEQITAPALVSSRIYIPLSHKLERFFERVCVCM